MSCPSRDALEAHLRGEPGSAAGALEAHLGTCASCRTRAQAVRRVRGLLQLLPGAEPSAAGWQRIDRRVLTALEEPRARSLRPSPWRRAIPAAALASAALLAVTLRPSPQGPAPSSEPIAEPALALAIGGDAHTGHPPPRVVEGDPVSTGLGSLTIQTAASTGVQLAENSQARMVRLRRGQTEVALESGELLAEVKPLLPGQSFRVRAGDLTVSVVGTAFLVERRKGAVRVAVVHGLVRVTREGEAHPLMIPGGSEAVVGDGAPLSGVPVAAADEALAARFPLALPDLPPEQIATRYREASIETTPPGARARVDGADRGITPLQLLASEGPHDLTVTLPGRPPQRRRFQVSGHRTAAQVALPPADDAPPPAPTPQPAPAIAPRARAPALAAPEPAPRPQISFQQAFHEVAVTHQAEVEECFAAHDGAFARQIHLVLNIQATGQVTPPVQVEEPGVDSRFVDCVNRVARGWQFPPPGRSYEVSIPFDLAPRR